MTGFPLLSVVIPTFNNAAVLGSCLTAWERYAGDQPVELVVVEDGCRDDTPQLLEDRSRSPWGRRCLRWFHEDNVHELRAFMEGYNRTLRERLGKKGVGLYKISVQTGTSHGGVVLPDGKIADVTLDLVALEELSRVAEKESGLAGAVQHGASTLPDDAFNAFPRVGACEIHLATNFQNLLYDSLPPATREKIYRWLDQNAAEERKPKDSPDQFYYKTRKKALGPFKRELWDLPEAVRESLGQVYDRKFAFLFEQLAVSGTAELVNTWVSPPEHHRRAPDGLAAAVIAAPDDPDAGE